MARKKNVTQKALDAATVGPEPKLERVVGSNDPQLTRAYNWYNYMHDSKKGKVWLIKWMKDNLYNKSDIEAVKNAPDWTVSTTACWTARLANNGTSLADENINFIKSRIEMIIDKYKEIKAEKKEAPPTVNIQARVAAKNNMIFDEAEGIADKYLDKNHEEMYDFLTRWEASPALASKMLEYYTKIRDELQEDSTEMREMHGGAVNLRHWRKAYESIVADIERYINNKKVVKAPTRKRKTKVKSVADIVKSVKYQLSDSELKLQSANPEQLVGATQVWLYNTKYKALSVYNADNPRGLSVKGSTLIKFDAKSSITKKLRKPDESIQELLSAGKVHLRKFMDNLTTKPSSTTGRINNNTIILRVIQ